MLQEPLPLFAPRSKPPHGAPIDPRHPLARGLVGAWALNEGAGFLVRSQAPLKSFAPGVITQTSFVNPWEGGRGGMTSRGLKSTAALDSWVVLPNTVFPLMSGNVAYTMFVRVIVDAINGGNSQWVGAGAATTRNTILLGTGASGTDVGLFHFGDDFTTSVGETHVGSGRANAFAGTYDPGDLTAGANGTRKLFYNGRQVGANNHPTGTLNLTNTNWALMKYLASPSAFSGTMECAFIWNRALTPGEIASLSQNPWQMYYVFDVSQGAEIAIDLIRDCGMWVDSLGQIDVARDGGLPVDSLGWGVRDAGIPVDSQGQDPFALAHSWNVRRFFESSLFHGWSVSATTFESSLQHQWDVLGAIPEGELLHEWRVIPNLPAHYSNEPSPSVSTNDVQCPVADIDKIA